MSLLTEKQIDEIIDMATHQDEFARILKLKFDNWNENQPDQFEPNWDEIPEEVVEVQMKIDWLRPDTGDYYEEPFFIKIYKRPLRAHTHAQIMMKYAEVAARRIDPWTEFEVFMIDDQEWVSNNGPLYFIDNCQYRHIGETK
jgi:hypothetical protein